MPENRSSTISDPATLRAVQRRTMRVLALAQVIGTVGVGVAPSIGILLAGQVTQDETWAGLARTASTLGAALLGLPLGTLAARRGRRFALTTGWWLAAAGAALLVVAAQWMLVVPLFLGLLLIGSGSAVSLQSRFAATDLAEPQRRARSLALVVWVGTLGSVLGPNLGLPGQLVGRATGLSVFAGAFLIAAVCLALAGVVVQIWLRPDPLLALGLPAPVRERVAGRRPPGRVRLVIAEIRSNRRARIAVIAILTAQVVMVAVMTMTPVHLEHQGGSITVIGLTISLHVAGMYALAPLVGLLVDRRGHRISIAVGIGVLAVSLAVGALGADRTSWTVVCLVLLGVGWSFVNVAGSALFSQSIADTTRAASQGGVDALANLCGAVAAFAAGPLLAVTSFSFLAVAALLVLAPLTLLVSTRSLRLPADA